MLSLPKEDDFSDAVYLYTSAIGEEEIIDVSRDLFASGHYSLAIQEAFKAVEKFIQQETGLSQSGSTLMEQAFSPKKPHIFWSERKTISERDEQIGYMKIYSGCVVGIRNPCAHEFGWIDDAETAVEILVWAQHLLRKAKLSKHNKNANE